MSQKKGLKNGLSKLVLKQALKPNLAPKNKKTTNAKTDEDPVWRTIKKDSKPVKSGTAAYNLFLDQETPSKPLFVIPKQSTPNPRLKDLSFKAADWNIGQFSEVPGPTSRKQGSNPNLVKSLKTGKLIDMDRSTADKFRRGKLPIEGRLDLHGMTQDEASRHLSRFIEFSARQGKRCLIVVTGKGDPRKGGGILKQQVPEWLGLSPNREKILAVTKAQPKDGGAGALYVLLKRLR